MLPEKRKKLIVGIISIFVALVVVILIAKLSTFIKNRNVLEEKPNDDYSELYSYIGITLDSDNIYKLYGINEDTEKYLEVKTFYEVKDMINIDGKIVLYSDAVNELRYDEEKNEFYFYELDSYFNKNSQIKLTHDYLVINREDGLIYKKYNNEEYSIVSENKDYVVGNNKIYYIKDENLYEYDMLNKKEKNIIFLTRPEDIKLLAISNKYLFYLSIDKLYAIDLKDYSNKEFSDKKFYSISNDGFISLNNNILSNYSISKDTILYEYNLEEEPRSIIYLDDDLFYLSFTEKSDIIDLKEGKTWKSLDNKYIYLMRVK